MFSTSPASIAQDLPDDVEALKALLTQTATELNAERAARFEREQRVKQQSAQIETLNETIRKLLAHRFGRSSEKLPDLDSPQYGLFDEAEVEAPAADTPADEDGGIDVAGHKRRGRRAPLPANLPRVDVLHELPESERVCPHDGSTLTRIGEDVSEQLDIVPAKVQVLRHVRAKYACPCCDRHIVLADRAAQLLPKSLASEGLLAYVATSKYIDGMPLNRISKAIARIGVDIPRQTLAAWMIAVGEAIEPIIARLDAILKSMTVMQMDETGVQVLAEPGRPAQSRSYMWVRTGGDEDGTPIRLFHYDPSRSGEVPIELLEGFKGTLQTDGYKGYGAVHKAYGLTPAFCMAHCRRYYVDGLKALKINPKNLPNPPPPKARRLLKGLRFIQKLYAIEARIRGSTPEERYRVRQAEAVPILDEFKAWVEQTQHKVLPSGPLGAALTYTANQWSGLVRYAEDGRLEIDTNRTENAIRPFVLGRRAWLFSASQNGAHASARLYSLIETALCRARHNADYAERQTMPSGVADPSIGRAHLVIGSA